MKHITTAYLSALPPDAKAMVLREMQQPINYDYPSRRYTVVDLIKGAILYATYHPEIGSNIKAVY